MESEGRKKIIPFNVIANWTKLKILLGSKLKGHIDTLTETSNLIELYKRS